MAQLPLELLALDPHGLQRRRLVAVRARELGVAALEALLRDLLPVANDTWGGTTR